MNFLKVAGTYSQLLKKKYTSKKKQNTIRRYKPFQDMRYTNVID